MAIDAGNSRDQVHQTFDIVSATTDGQWNLPLYGAIQGGHTNQTSTQTRNQRITHCHKHTRLRQHQCIAAIQLQGFAACRHYVAVNCPHVQEQGVGSLADQQPQLQQISAAAAAAPTGDKPTPPPVAAAAGGSGAVVAAGSGSGAAGAAPEGSAAAPVAAPLLPMVNRQLGQPCEQSTQCASSLCSNKHCAPEGFAYIPAGSFTRGTPTSELGHKSNEWQAEVVIESPFFLQMAEVSQRDWKAVMESNPSTFAACGDGCPVDSLSWWEGAAYLNARSAKEQLTACYQLYDCTGDAKQAGIKPFACQSATLKEDCTGYRYPTEVEWEYAARAGTTSATYRGNIRLDSTRGFVCGPESALDGIAVWYCGAEVRFESGVSGAGHQGPVKIGPGRARTRGDSTTCSATWPSGRTLPTSTARRSRCRRRRALWRAAWSGEAAGTTRRWRFGRGPEPRSRPRRDPRSEGSVLPED